MLLLLPLHTSLSSSLSDVYPSSLYCVDLAPFGSHHEMKVGGQGTVTGLGAIADSVTTDGSGVAMNGLAALVPATVEPHAAGAQELAIDQRSVSWGLVVLNCKQWNHRFPERSVHACCPEL